MNLSTIHRIWGKGGARLMAGDALVVLLCFTLTGVLFVRVNTVKGRVAAIVVEVSGSQVLTAGVDETGIREVNGPLGTTRIEFGERQVRIVSSPCPLKLCQRAGWAGAAGEMLACLPNEVVVRLTGTPSENIDALSR